MLRSMAGSLQESSSRRIASAPVCLPLHLSNSPASAPVGLADPARSFNRVLFSHSGPVTACATAMQAPASAQMSTVPVEELRSAIRAAVSSLGYSEADTETVVEVCSCAVDLLHPFQPLLCIQHKRMQLYRCLCGQSCAATARAASSLWLGLCPDKLEQALLTYNRKPLCLPA